MPAPHPDIDLLTPADAARILGLSVDMVRILANGGQLATAAKTVRGARLFRRDDVEELAAARAGRPVRHHSVQFYETSDHLAGVIAAFLVDGLRAGGPAIVIATEPHRRAVVAQLATLGIPVDELVASGQLVLLDARATLATLMIDGALDEARFREHAAALITRARQAFPRARLRAYGEMVDLLWKDGRRDAALALEELWNRLAAVESFAVLCAYEMSGFPAEADGPMFDRICAAHTRVVPTESFHQEGGVDHRHREIARLQQRARALETAKRAIQAKLGHQLRDPLAPIVTALELQRRRGEASREHDVIARQVRRLHRLADEISEEPAGHRPDDASSSGAAVRAGPNRRVLVVDDNHDAAEMLAELLVECGHTVEQSHSGDEALATARRFQPELALLDLGLPDVDGYELAARLRAEHAAMRLIAVSGYGDRESKTRSAEAGFEAHLVKPVRLDDLLKILESP